MNAFSAISRYAHLYSYARSSIGDVFLVFIHSVFLQNKRISYSKTILSFCVRNCGTKVRLYFVLCKSHTKKCSRE